MGRRLTSVRNRGGPPPAGRREEPEPGTLTPWVTGDLAAHLADGSPAVVFDLGGVLLQGGLLAAETERDFFAALDPGWGIDPRAAWDVWARLQPGVETGALPEDGIWEEIAGLATTARPAPDTLRRLFLAAGYQVPAAVDLLHRVRGRGCPVAVATNHARRWGQEWARRYPWFAELADQGRVISSETLGVRKPDPRFFSGLMDALGIGAGWFLDDREDNVRAARDAGLRALLVRPALAWQAIAPGGPGR